MKEKEKTLIDYLKIEIKLLVWSTFVGSLKVYKNVS